MVLKCLQPHGARSVGQHDRECRDQSVATILPLFTHVGNNFAPRPRMWATMLPLFTHVCKAGVACWRQLAPVATDKTCIVVAAVTVV